MIRSYGPCGKSFGQKRFDRVIDRYAYDALVGKVRHAAGTVYERGGWAGLVNDPDYRDRGMLHEIIRGMSDEEEDSITHDERQLLVNAVGCIIEDEQGVVNIIYFNDAEALKAEWASRAWFYKNQSSDIIVWELLENGPYGLTERDRIVVATASQLIQKILHAPFTAPAEMVSLAKLLHVLRKMPWLSTVMSVSVRLTGPTRRFGEHEMCDYWEVRVNGRLVEVSSRSDSADIDDSFTCLQWAAAPYTEPRHADYVDPLTMVCGRQPFDREVADLDLSQSGYILEVVDDGNPLLREEEAAAAEDAPGWCPWCSGHHDFSECAGARRALGEREFRAAVASEPGAGHSSPEPGERADSEQTGTWAKGSDPTNESS